MKYRKRNPYKPLRFAQGVVRAIAACPRWRMVTAVLPTAWLERDHTGAGRWHEGAGWRVTHETRIGKGHPYREPAGGYDIVTIPRSERDSEIVLALGHARNADLILSRGRGRWIDEPGQCERDVLDRATAGQHLTLWRVE